MSPEVLRGPISPPEAAERRIVQKPEAVFEVFNDLIAENLRGRHSKVLQKHALERLAARGIDRKTIFEHHMLDIEDDYRAAGWKVKYDRPVYWGGEDFEAYFEFTAPE